MTSGEFMMASAVPQGGHPVFTYLFAFLAALALLIFVHEFGHFLVARRLGVGVTKFSFGFGPKLLGVRRGETEYLVSAIPFGGYVKLVGESDGEEVSPEEKSRSFFHKPTWVKIAVVAAGPVGNLVFAVLVFWLVFMGGVPAMTPRIGVPEGTPAARAGLKSGDVVVSVAGRAVPTWDEMTGRIREGGAGRPLALVVRRGAGEIRATVVPEALDGKNEFGETVRETGIGVVPSLPPRIADVTSDSPAARAGLAPGDLVVEAGGTRVTTWEDLADRIRRATPGQSLVITVVRGAETIEVPVVPQVQEVRGPSGGTVKEPKIGIVAAPETVVRRTGPVRSLAKAGQETWRFIDLTARTVVKLIMRVVPAQTLGGPILIAQIAGDQARQGLSPFFYFLGLLSVNLGILNLFPIPILDGGQILFFVIEAFRRRPLSPQARAFAQQIGLAIILMLTALVFYNDIARIIAR